MIAIGALTPITAQARGPAVNPLACEEWFDQARRLLDRHGIADAGASLIEHHPQLRVTRSLAALRPAGNDAEARQRWLRLLADEARTGWRSELLRLPENATLPPASRRGRVEHMNDCVDALLTAKDGRGLALPEIEDAYADWQRWLGAYAITSVMARPGILGYKQDAVERLRTPPPPAQRHYLPPPFRGNAPQPRQIADNPLGIPLPGAAAEQALLAQYAPVLSVAADDAANRPGTLGISDGRPEVVPHTASMYHWLSWTRFRGQTLLQLNYQFWFSHRPAQGWLDPYAGHLDGLIWRVTLKPDGSVLTYDSIHSCGCYHTVFPVDRRLVPVAPQQAGQPVFFPGRLPDAARQRIRLTLQPDTHYVVAVASWREGDGIPVQYYQPTPASRLRAIKGNHGYQSLFRPNGRVPSSRRLERFWFWPLGVPSAGSMRQPGHHAIAFIGKRHFDDPDMLDALFRLPRSL
jgi:hypothetical protein